MKTRNKVLITLCLTVMYLCLSFTSLSNNPPEKDRMAINGKITFNSTIPIEEAIIEIYNNGQKIQNYSTQSCGTFSFILSKMESYKILIKRNRFEQQELMITPASQLDLENLSIDLEKQKHFDVIEF